MINNHITSQIEIERINEPQIAMRSDVSIESIIQLAESIERIGLINPIHVKKDKLSYEIVAGHRRFLAMRELGYSVIPCIIVDGEDNFDVAVTTAENYNREEVSVIDEAKYFAGIMRKAELTQKQLAQFVHKSESYVSERMSVMNYSEKLLTALQNKEITFSVARELAKVNNESIMDMLVDNAVTNGCTPATAQAWRVSYNDLDEHVDDETDFNKITNIHQIESNVTNISICDFCDAETELHQLNYLKACPKCFSELTTPPENDVTI